MPSASGRSEFAPPPTPGFLRALGLAILAHGVLLIMLTAGVQWKRDATPVTVEAELWSAVPVEAAPPAQQPDTPPEPEQPPIPPAPVAPVAPVAPPKPVPTHEADIAVAKEKARLQKEKQLQQQQLDQEKQKRARLEQEKQAQLQQDQLKKEKLARDKEALAKAERDKKLQQEQRAQDAKAAETAKQKTALKAREDAKKLDELRQQNMKRMAGLAGTPSGSGDERSAGTAAKSAGPSAGYGGRIVARVWPNITYTETIAGNPVAEVEVRTSPDGTILNRKLTKSSGVASWDAAVLKAIDKTEVLPRDVDGRVPPSLILSFRPQPKD